MPACFARELAEHGDLLGEVQFPERSREVRGMRLGQEGPERVPVGVPESPADLLEEIAGVPGLPSRRTYGRNWGGELGGGATGGPVRDEGVGPPAPLHEARGQAGQRRGQAPVAAEAIVTTATDAESCQ